MARANYPVNREYELGAMEMGHSSLVALYQSYLFLMDVSPLWHELSQDTYAAKRKHAEARRLVRREQLAKAGEG